MDPASLDMFDPESLRLPADQVGEIEARSRPPRHRLGEPFLKGPIPWAWWSTACRLPGQALQVASAIRYQAGLRRMKSLTFGLATLEGSMGVLPDSARRALCALEAAGLVSVSRRAGCKPVVAIQEIPESGSKREPLYGPIPWAWWLVAARLPGRSLQLASALWFLVGWKRRREARFELGLSQWAELGLSRQSAGRALECLEGAGLVSVERPPGRKPIVSLLDKRVQSDPTAGP